jgi:hypothetical protein
VASGSVQQAKNSVSGKIETVAGFFKSSAEHSKQPPKIENCGWKPESSAERWAFRRKFETATRTIEKLRGKSTLSVKIGDVRGKCKSPAGGRMSRPKI